MSLRELDSVLDAYLACALWSSNADHLDPEGTGAAGSLEDHFSASDLAPEALEDIRHELAGFLQANGPDVDAWALALGSDAVGHDLWLTRNRHGAGFWDRFSGGHPLEAVGQRLTAEAHALGTSDLYAGDDGALHVS